jgi:hypothetical protein
MATGIKSELVLLARPLKLSRRLPSTIPFSWFAMNKQLMLQALLFVCMLGLLCITPPHISKGTAPPQDTQVLFSYTPGQDISEANGSFTRSSPARQFDGAQWVEVGADVLRDNHYFIHPRTLELERSVLIEPERENRVPHTNTLNQLDYTGGYTVEIASGLIAGEDGFRVIGESDGGWNLKTPDPAFGTEGETVTFSAVYEVGNFASVTTRSSNIFQTSVNLELAQFSNENGLISAQVEQLSSSGPNGGAVQRVKLTAIVDDQELSDYTLFRKPGIGNIVYLHHAQIESGEIATSPIVTGGAPVTRAEDHLNFAPSWPEQEVTQYVRYFDYTSNEVKEEVQVATSDALLEQPQAGRAYTHIAVAEGALTVEQMRGAIGAPEPPVVLEPNEDALLPQDEQYQIALYNWLSSLKVEDVESPQQPVSYSGGATEDEIYPLWVSELPRNRFLRYPAGHFVLDDGNGNGFEGDGQNVRILIGGTGSSDERALWLAAWWTSLDIPGINNPYYNNPNVKRRVMAQAAVDLMMLDEYFSNNSTSSGDFGGMQVHDHGVAFFHAHDVLPEDVQHQFLNGYERLLLLFQDPSNGYPRDVNSNMDYQGIAGWAHVAVIADELGRTELAEDIRVAVRTWLFGAPDATIDDATANPRGVLFHGAGHHTEQGGPEGSYSGIAIYFLSKAAAVVKDDPAWDFLAGDDGALARMLRWIKYQYFPQKGARWVGPSGYAKRTTADVVSGQSNSRGRDALFALVTDEGLPFLPRPREPQDNALPISLAEMESTVQSRLSSKDFSATDALTRTWGYSSQWTQRDGADFFTHYTPGTYDTWKNLVDTDDPSLRMPWEKPEPFNVGLGLAGQPPEWWAYKDADASGREWGFFLSAITNAGSGYGGGYKGGGALHTFWTPETGAIILSTLNDRFSQPDNRYGNIELWSVAHVWGVEEAGTPFSSAPRRTKDISADLDVVEPWIQKNFSFDNGASGASIQVLSTATDNGLRVEQTVTSDQSDSITELWGSIPVHYKTDSDQPDSQAATIDYWDGSAWQEMTTDLVSTEYIRLGRDWQQGDGPAYVYLTFPQSEEAKLSSQVWQVTYQESVHTRNIHTDMHGNPGTPQPFPADQTLTYTIQTEDPTADLPPGSPPEDEDDPEDNPDPSVFEHTLPEGWNLMGLNLTPANDSLSVLFEEVLDDVLVVKNTDGQLFSPTFDLDAIGTWDINEGYWIYTNSDAMLPVEGVPLEVGETEIPLAPGWQQVPYIGTEPIPVTEAFASIAEQLIMVRDANGGLYFPAEEVNTIGDLMPGEGYLVYVTDEATLVYPSSATQALTLSP